MAPYQRLLGDAMAGEDVEAAALHKDLERREDHLVREIPGGSKEDQGIRRVWPARH
jgi:hypothetical protein